MRSSFPEAGLAAAIVLVLVGCGHDGGVAPARAPSRVKFVTKLTPIEFSFPTGWYENPGKNPYDLQCFSPSEEVKAGVFAYRKAEFDPDQTPLSVMQDQVADLKSKRQKFFEMEPIQTRDFSDKSITSVTYTGEKDSVTYCYRFSLIEFKADSNRFAVVLQVSIPEAWNAGKVTLDEIVQSARLLPENQ